VTRLLGIEIDRFASRLLIRLGVLGLLLLSSLTLIGAYQQAQPPSAAPVAEAQKWYDQDAAEWERSGEEQLASCKAEEKRERENVEASGGDPDSVSFGCDEMKPTLENYLGQVPSFAPDTTGLLSALSPLYVLVPVLLAVSFIAAEFSTGAIGNWLTFAPRRTRVLLSKLFAAAVATIPYAAAGLAIVIGGSWLIYNHFGEAAGGFGDTWAVAGRVLALSVVVALLGAALGTLSRHTAGALGIFLGWVVLVEAILVNIVSSLKPWSVINNITAWVNGGTQYYVDSCTSTSSGQVCTSIAKEISQTHGALVVGGLTALLVVAALLVFRRRDIG